LTEQGIFFYNSAKKILAGLYELTEQATFIGDGEAVELSIIWAM
jgi:hypothetical protein